MEVARRSVKSFRILLVFGLSCVGGARAQEPNNPPPTFTKDVAPILYKNCASCHAIGRTGDSPRKGAPTFRSLGQRYPVESLEEALAEGLMSGHPDMPEFSFDADEVGAIIAYLKSIQTR